MKSAASAVSELKIRHTFFAIAFVILGIILSSFLYFILPANTMSWAFFLCTELSYLGAAFLVLRIARARFQNVFLLSSPSFFSTIGGVFLGLGALVFSLSLFSPLYDAEYVSQVEGVFQSVQASLGTFGLIFLFGIFAPFCEEMLFRGLIFRSIKTRAPSWVAILGSAVLFGLFHIHPVHMLVAFVLGLLCALGSWKTSLLWTAIIAHTINNTVAILISLWAPSDFSLPPWMAIFGLCCAALGLLCCQKSQTICEN